MSLVIATKRPKFVVSWVAAICFAIPFVACGDDDEGKSTFESGGSSGSGGSGGGGAGGSAGTILTDSAGGSSAGSNQDGTAGGTCADFGDDADCKTCLTTNCCSEMRPCDASEDCIALVECTGACPDPNDNEGECVQACVAGHGDSLTPYNGALICMGALCSDECRHL